MMSFDEMRERLANRDAIRERQALEEQAEEDREKEELAALRQQQLRNRQAQQLQQAQAEAPAAVPEAAPAAAAVTAAAADTSSEVARKIRDRFMKDVSKVIVKVLTPFRKEGVTKGQIKTNEDFKHLAKKVSSRTLTGFFGGRLALGPRLDNVTRRPGYIRWDGKRKNLHIGSSVTL